MVKPGLPPLAWESWPPRWASSGVNRYCVRVSAAGAPPAWCGGGRRRSREGTQTLNTRSLVQSGKEIKSNDVTDHLAILIRFKKIFLTSHYNSMRTSSKRKKENTRSRYYWPLTFDFIYLTSKYNSTPTYSKAMDWK